MVAIDEVSRCHIPKRSCESAGPARRVWPAPAVNSLASPSDQWRKAKPTDLTRLLAMTASPILPCAIIVLNLPRQVGAYPLVLPSRAAPPEFGSPFIGIGSKR